MPDPVAAVDAPSTSEALAVVKSSIWHGIAGTLRPPHGSPEGNVPPLLVGLTVVSGIVDAVAYLRLGHVFVANMTGNVVFLGFSAVGAPGLSPYGSLLALGCFLPGGVAAGRLASRLAGDGLVQLRVATAAEIALCSAAIALAAATGSHLDPTSRYTVIALLALALGVQNATARRLAVADLTTTVLTLTLTGIAADSRLAGGSGAKTGRRLLAVSAMVLGAVVGALLVLRVDVVAALALADAILVTVCAGSYVAAKRTRSTESRGVSQRR